MTADISRPGLENDGLFLTITQPERIQLVGMKEWSYLGEDELTTVIRSQDAQPETPVIINARNLEIPEEML